MNLWQILATATITGSYLVAASPSPAQPLLDFNRIVRSCQAGERRACLRLAEIAKTRPTDVDSPVAQQASVSALTDQVLLADVAKMAWHWEVRQDATHKLTDQAVLAQIARLDPDEHVRAAATEGLTDTSLLVAIATTDPAVSVRAAAVRNPNLNDGALLAEIARKGLRDAALANPHFQDQTVIALIARSDNSEYLRETAVKMLTDQRTLTEIATADKAQRVRVAAVQNTHLGDAAILSAVAKNDAAAEVRRAAIERITDQAMLADLVRTDKDSGVRSVAASRLTDARLLAGLSLAEDGQLPKGTVRSKLRQQIPEILDAALLSDLASRDQDADVRKAAIENSRLADQRVLETAALSDKALGVRAAAISRLTSSATLAKIAATEPQVFLRWNAVRNPRLSASASVAEIAVTDADWRVRAAAVERLSDEGVLAHIARTDADASIRWAALEKLTDQKALLEIAQADASPWVRIGAEAHRSQRGSCEVGGTPAGQPAASRVREVRRSPKDGLEYVWIPPGEFEMGCAPGDTKCEDWEKPRHAVRLSHGFWLARTEVPVGAFKRFAAAAGLWLYDARKIAGAREDHPIASARWSEAAAYCEWSGARLPTEAEWEYAARAGQPAEKYVWGNDVTSAKNGPKQANIADESFGRTAGKDAEFVSGYDDGYAGTSPVGSFAPNGFGLYDMAGNVTEWCADAFDRRYYAGAPAVDPKGPDFEGARFIDRVRRGGSWQDVPRISGRDWSLSDLDAGFRCARDGAP